jgi:ATP/maltotriose-dependent transcriptional regulator MalT
METVKRWIELFTEEQIRKNVPLALCAGWVGEMTGDALTVGKWTNIALAARADDSPMPCGAGTTRAFQASFRAVVGRDGVSDMRRQAELAGALSSDSHPSWRAATYVTLGIARWLSGAITPAERALRQAIEDGYPVNPIAELASYGYLSLLMADRQRWAEAEAEVARAKRRLQESELCVSPGVSVVPLAEARVLAHRGTPGPAGHFQIMETSLADSRTLTWMNLLGIVTLAQVALDAGDTAAVERLTAAGMGTLRAWPDAGILRSRLERLRATLESRRLVGSLTPTERTVLELLATHLTSAPIAERLHISSNTLKSHVRSLFQKLDVHSRSEVVERGIRLSLLKG